MADEQKRDFEINLMQSLLRDAEVNVGTSGMSIGDDALTQLVWGT